MQGHRQKELTGTLNHLKIRRLEGGRPESRNAEADPEASEAPGEVDAQAEAREGLRQVAQAQAVTPRD